MKRLSTLLCLHLFSISAWCQTYTDLLYNASSCPANVSCLGYVSNPSHAASGNNTMSFATMYNNLGVGSSVVLEVGFSTPAPGGSLVGVTLQKGNQTLSLGLLSNITIELISSSNTVVAQKNGLQLEDLGLLSGSGNQSVYAATFYTTLGNYDIERIRITLGGVLNALNDIRVYNGFYLAPATNGSGKICGLEYATQLVSSSCSGLFCSVPNPGNAVDTSNLDNYATLNIPVGLIGVLGTADIHLRWTTPGAAGQYIGFIIGQENVLLNLALLSNVSVSLYDGAGGKVYEKNGFSTVDLTLLSGSSGKSIIGFYSPVNFASARINLTQIVGLLTSVRIYGAIKFNPTPDIIHITTSPYTNLCAGDTVILTADSGYSNYLWSTGDTTQSITVHSSGTYTLTGLDTSSCKLYSAVQPITINPVPPTPQINGGTVARYICANDSVHISITTLPHHTISWNTGHLSDSLWTSAPGIYIATHTDTLGCSSASDSIHVIQDLIAASIHTASNQYAFCYHPSDSLLLSVNTSGDILWENGDTTQSRHVPLVSDSMYHVVVTSANGCVAYDTIQISINPNPAIPTINGLPLGVLSDTICSGDTLLLSVNAPGLQTLWNTGSTSSFIEVTSAGNYSLTVIDSLGCTAQSDTLAVLVDSPSVYISPDTSICAGESITLAAYGNGSLLWGTGNSGSSIIVTPASSSTYQVTLTSLAGCITTASVNVSVISTHTMQAEDDVFDMGDQVPASFDLAENDSLIVGSQIWTLITAPLHGNAQIQDGIVSYTPSGQPVKHDSFTYSICINSTCGYICDTANVIITFTNAVEPEVEIPRGLSPNGDGINDKWVIDGLENYPNNRLTILSRWGDILYQAKPYTNDWDGKASSNVLAPFNTLVPDGTYYFVLILDENTDPIKGFLEIRK